MSDAPFLRLNVLLFSMGQTWEHPQEELNQNCFTISLVHIKCSTDQHLTVHSGPTLCLEVRCLYYCSGPGMMLVTCCFTLFNTTCQVSDLLQGKDVLTQIAFFEEGIVGTGVERMDSWYSLVLNACKAPNPALQLTVLLGHDGTF